MSDYDLPEETYRVFPAAGWPTRNSYDSPPSVRKAIPQRKDWKDWRTKEPVVIKVFRAKTEWVDVTEEFVK